MLVDKVTLFVKAGDGGNGASTFLRNGMTARGGPDGGNGGNGGHIYFRGSHNLTDLREFRFKKKVVAANGIPGKNQKRHGKNAEHTTILVPLGTTIKEVETGRIYEIKDSERSILIARGGIGGRGNDEFKSATNQAPMYSEEGTLGEQKTLHLEMKLIAEIGLIGLPNAGKSSLLSMLTNARPKVGDYPFTTLEPNVGMFESHPIADIPGIIEGASKGKGLGITFLKHIEKTRILIHCLDATDENINQSYETVRKEFEAYSESLIEKREIIVITKADLVTAERLEILKKKFKNKSDTVLSCSIYDSESIEELKKKIKNLLETD